MEATQRRIVKISRFAQQYVTKRLQHTGIGLAEYDLIHCVRHNPGLNQTGLCRLLGIDKAALARRVNNLEQKGYIERRPDPADGRSNLIFPTDQAYKVRDARVECEEAFFAWLMLDADPEDVPAFLRVLEHVYQKAKNERRNGFKTLLCPELDEKGLKRGD